MSITTRVRELAQNLSTFTLLCTVAVAGCSPAAMTMDPTPTLSAIVVSAGDAPVAKGLSQQLSARGTYSDGTSRDVSAAVLWSSADESIAAVSISGLARGAGVGSVLITATLAGKSGATTLVVSDAIITSLELSAQDGLAKGLTRRIVATGTYSDGTSADVSDAATWTSTDASLASVSSEAGSGGLVTALAQGTVQISAALAGKSASTDLVVTDPVRVSLSVSTTSDSIAVGDTLQYAATLTLSDGTTEDVSTQVQWSSSDETIAIVSNDSGTMGLATGMGSGSAAITAALGDLTGGLGLTVL